MPQNLRQIFPGVFPTGEEKHDRMRAVLTHNAGGKGARAFGIYFCGAGTAGLAQALDPHGRVIIMQQR